MTLTPWEFKACVDLANARMTVSNDRGMNNASTYARTYAERLREETIGACGEMVFCKTVGRFWSPSVNTFHAIADVGANIEVRSTALADGCLIVRDNDADDRWFVLVAGEPPDMTVIGSILGGRAKCTEWRRNPHGHRQSWFVPQTALRPIREPGTTHLQEATP